MSLFYLTAHLVLFFPLLFRIPMFVLRAQQVTTLLSSNELGVVGTCCVAHANERNNCQHCWRSSKEAMHSGTIILAMCVDVFTRPKLL